MEIPKEHIIKRVGNLSKDLLSDTNISKAIDEVNKAHRWLKGHRPNKTVLWVETTKRERIKELREIVADGFVPTMPKIKRRYDRNAKKWRDIAEPLLYPDQYVHHMLIQVLEPVMMRGMDPYCCGSIKGRGTHYGVKRIKRWMGNDRKGTKWCAELDIHHFYQELKPCVVLNRMKKLVKDWVVLDLIERVLRHGVIIGAYFSQWFANTVLQELDVIVRKLGVSHYIRYMDNFTVFSGKRRVIRKVVKTIRLWLDAHDMRLKGNWQYFKTRERLPNALGYRYGHTFTLIRKGRVLNLKRQMKSFYKQRGCVASKFASGLLARISGFAYCNARDIIVSIVPKGLIKRLKAIVSDSSKQYVTWETCLGIYRSKTA